LRLSDEQKILILRYGTNIVSNCIQLHEDVIRQYGYCWFAKLGRAPSKKVISDVFKDGKGIVILYSKGAAFVCHFIDITEKRPIEAYPMYYDEYIYGSGYIPSIYIKLKSIRKLAPTELERLIVSSSRNRLTDTLSRSMNSFFVAETEDYIKSVKSKPKPNKKNNLKSNKLNVKDCKYRNNGICKCKSCISYDYECIHPDMCLKQKR